MFPLFTNSNLTFFNQGRSKGSSPWTFQLDNLHILTDGHIQSIYPSGVTHDPPVTTVTNPSLSLELNNSLKIHPGGKITVHLNLSCNQILQCISSSINLARGCAVHVFRSANVDLSFTCMCLCDFIFLVLCILGLSLLCFAFQF